MSSKISLWTGLIGIGATIVLVQPNVAAAKSSVEIANTARAITVLITEPEPDKFGSGVLLQRQGDIYTVITSAHVFKNKTSYKIKTSDDRQYEIINSSIRSAPGNIDLAIVKFRSTVKYPTAKLGNSTILKSGMAIYVAGFPDTGKSKSVTKPEFVFSTGKVSANSSRKFEQGYSLVYSNETQPGMSGGPVLNSAGELVAIHGRGDRDNNNVKTGFNLGIPIDLFATVASNLGVNLGTSVVTRSNNTAPKADDYIVSAAQKQGQEDYLGSLADLARAIQLDPKNPLAHFSRGTLKRQKFEDVQGAIADYNRTIQLDPKYAEAYEDRGFLKQEKLQDTQGALADYNRAISLDPKSVIGYLYRGNLKNDKLQDIQGALTDYNRAISLDSKLAVAYNNRSKLKYQKLQDIQGALIDCNRAIALSPNDALFYNNRGTLKSGKLKDPQGALADFDRAIQLEPKLALAYYNRGALKMTKLGNMPGALADSNRAIELDPELADAFAFRGSLKHAFSDRASGIADIQQAAKL
ncbi:tetratricopeptide repeat-containing serine protease family protein, partial [Chamaesiphon sp. OTE_20_metabat_361]|uniref:tetratricopeptide repeat-containing serine protease family protein n=1 Tax=Chamaesiphon sp. OTE_20_metabat_361 TaxID=2964689 RepID=UPI00286AA6DF